MLEKAVLRVLVALVDAVQLHEAQHGGAEPEEAAKAEGHHAVLEREEHGERVHELQRGRQEEAERAEPVEPRDPRLERREPPREPLVHDLDVGQVGAQQHEERADEEWKPVAQNERKVGPADVDHTVVGAGVVAQQQERAREQEQQRAGRAEAHGPVVDARWEEAEEALLQQRLAAVEVLVQPHLQTRQTDRPHRQNWGRSKEASSA